VRLRSRVRGGEQNSCLKQEADTKEINANMAPGTLEPVYDRLHGLAHDANWWIICSLAMSSDIH